MRPALALLVPLLCLAAAPPLSAQTVALQCERLFDSRAGQLRGAHTIVVRQGLIAEVLPGTVAVADSRVVDLSGRTCLPGWTDLHVHLGSSPARRAIPRASVWTRWTTRSARSATPKRP